MCQSRQSYVTCNSGLRKKSTWSVLFPGIDVSHEKKRYFRCNGVGSSPMALTKVLNFSFNGAPFSYRNRTMKFFCYGSSYGY